MRVIGIDPGSHATGWGLVERQGNRYRSARSGVVRAAAGMPLPERLATVYHGIQALLREETPDAVAVETPFYAKSVRSTLVLGQVRGVVLLAVQEAGTGLFEYAPREVKQAVVGNGSASKEQIQFMVKRLLGLREDPPSDAADALAVAICHHHRGALPVAR